MEDLTGRQFGPYRIVAPLGEGGMAVVYRAYQPNVDRDVALKILPAYFARDPQFVGRFQQEARLLANLQHVNILPVHDFGESDGYTYIVMPLVQTGTLGELLGDRPLALPRIERIISQIASALDYAHSRGIVHRDIKPSNILLTEQGDCLLTDFGIAKIVEGTSTFTQMGGTLGTPTYMSPEQIRGEKLDGRSDIYSLGIVLYEMATGRPPFVAETPPALFVKHLHDPLPPPHVYNADLPDGVQRVILKALAKRREDRFATAGEMAAALSAAVAGQPTLRVRDEEARPAAPAKRRVVPETEAAFPVPPERTPVQEPVPEPTPPPTGKRTPIPETEPFVPQPPREAPAPRTEQVTPKPPVKTPVPEGEPTPPKTTEGAEPKGGRRFPAWAIGVIALIVVGGLAGGLYGLLRPGAEEPTPTAILAAEATATTAPAVAPSATHPVVAEPSPTPRPTDRPVTPTTVPTEMPSLAELAGRTVRVAAPWTGAEQDGFERVNARFTELTGIEISYEYLPDPGGLLELVEAGAAPDVALVGQPVIMHHLAETNNLVRLWPEIAASMRANLAPTWIDLGSHNGVPYGVMYRLAIKSLVWYPRQAFEAAGYEVPATWEALIALSNQMVADGRTPWCMGMESGDATGWVATDWLEDLLLRTAGPEVYDQWASHRLPFESDPVMAAAEPMAEIWFNPGYVRGGTDAILNTSFMDAASPMFQSPPGCYLHRQASFITGFLPEEVQSRLDEQVGVFVLPGIDPRWGQPLLIAGDQAVILEDRPEVRVYVQYLADGDSVEPWAREGGATFPHRDQDFGWYPTETDRVIAELLVGAEIARFDASDQMPPEVGSGAFWTGMVEWLNGAPLPEILAEIDGSWPGGPAGGAEGGDCQDPLGCVRIAPGAPIQVGTMLALSSEFEWFDPRLGLDAERGIEIAAADRGEILGHPIELVGEDSGCSEEGGERAAMALTADPQILAIVGPSCSRAARTAIPIVCSRHVAMVSPSATSAEIAGGDRPEEFGCFLRTGPNEAIQGIAAAEYARGVLGVTRAATVQDDTLYANILVQAFVERFRQMGGEITAQEGVAPDGTGAEPALTRIAGSQPELVFYPVFEEAGGRITREARSTPGLEEVHLLGTDGMFSPRVLEMAGDAALGFEWVVPDLSAVGLDYESFVAQYEERYGELPADPFHAHAYDAAQLIFQAIEKAAVAGEDGTLVVGRGALLEALYAARGYFGLTGRLSCGPDGECAQARTSIYRCTGADPAAWNPGAAPENNPRQIGP